MSKYQDQLNSGKIINRPSDDPVVAIKGMGYRVELEKNQQYQRNMREAHTWLDSTDESLNQVGSVLIRVKELVVQAANDTNTTEDRQKINEEIAQIREHIRDLGNTKIGENYIFSGTKTNSPLFAQVDLLDPNSIGINPEVGIPTVPPAEPAPSQKSVDINVFDGISFQVNTIGVDIFKKIDDFMGELEEVLKNPEVNGEQISATLGMEINKTGGTTAIPALDGLNADILQIRAEVGAKQNRVELMEDRLKLQEINVTKQMSLNEDTDYAKTITEMATAESIHQASLSVGAKIIQQTLVDFIR